MRARRGQSLLEFALVSVVVYVLLAGILTFGHALYVAQGLQTAADLGGREISRTPLDPNITLEDALNDSDVRRRIFDEAFLVVDLNAFYTSNPNGNFFLDVVPQMPLLNQQLASMMILDQPNESTRLMRYPGALLTRASPISEPAGSPGYPSWVAASLTVGIPVVVNRTDDDGFETIRWVPVVEEIDTEDAPGDNTAPNPDPFQLAQDPANVDHRGVVALRINYPFQSASMSSFRPNPAGPFEPNLSSPNVADDGEVNELNPSDRPGGLTAAPLLGGGTYGGQFGLGAQDALAARPFDVTGGRPVRPYRRLISAQAIYRREVFLAP